MKVLFGTGRHAAVTESRTQRQAAGAADGYIYQQSHYDGQ